MQNTHGDAKVHLEAARRDAAILVPLSEGIRGDHFARPLLLNNLGTVAMAAGNRALASRYFEDARGALSGIAVPDLELLCIDKNRAMVATDATIRESLARGVWDRLRSELGETHLSTLDALDGYARYVVDPEQALTLIARLCNDYDQAHAELIAERAICRSYQAFLTGLRGDRDHELQLYESVVSLAGGASDEGIARWGRIAAGYAAFLRGDHTAAVAAWRPVVAAYGQSPTWWVRLYAGPAELGLGLAAHAQGDDHEAAHYLKIASEVYRTAIDMNENTDFRLRLAQATRVLDEIQHREATGRTATAR